MVDRRLPHVRIPRADRPHGWSVAGSLFLHALLIFLVIAVQRAVPPQVSRRPGITGDPGGGGGIRFIRIDESPAAASAAAPVPDPVPAPVPLPVPVTPPLRKLDIPLPTGTVEAAGAGSAGTAGGSGGGAGGGAGTGLGTDSGPGQGGEGGDIFPPRPKYTILPPLPQPSSVRGKTFRVHFWVDADGRVTRVDVQPQIRDAAYRQQFLALMRDYTFEPAHRLDGTRVAGETDITLTL